MFELTKRIEKLGIKFNYDITAKNHFAKIAFDEVFGARTLRRAIQQELENKLSKYLLNGTIKRGDTVKTIFKDNKLSLIPS